MRQELINLLQQLLDEQKKQAIGDVKNVGNGGVSGKLQESLPEVREGSSSL